MPMTTHDPRPPYDEDRLAEWEVREHQAVTALHQLRAVADLRTGLDVAATALAAEFLDAFATARKLWRRLDGGHICVRRLQGRPCQQYTVGCPWVPAHAQLSEWCRGDQTVAIISQPMWLDPDEIRATMEWCDYHGLDCAIDIAPSYSASGPPRHRTHYLGLRVMFTRRGFSWTAKAPAEADRADDERSRPGQYLLFRDALPAVCEEDA